MRKGRLLFLGTGGSMGVPEVSCTCAVCRSTSTFNKRLRSSVLLSIGEQRFLIDAGPDFRDQALLHDLRRLDGVLFTHTHFDHVGGIDELRAFYLHHQVILPCLVSRPTYAEIRKRYDYLFGERDATRSLPAQLSFEILEDERGTINFHGLPVRYLTYQQGGMDVTGYCIGKLAYISDIRNYHASIFEDLKGIETLIVSGLKQQPSYMHFSLGEAAEFAQRVGAKEIWITHMAHDIDYAESSAQLPENIRLAYDGLEIEFDWK